MATTVDKARAIYLTATQLRRFNRIMTSQGLDAARPDTDARGAYGMNLAGQYRANLDERDVLTVVAYIAAGGTGTAYEDARRWRMAQPDYI